MKNKRRAAPGVFPSPWGDGRRKAAALGALYTCSAARHRNAVFEPAQAHGWPEEALHRRYFSLPEGDARVDPPFLLRLARSGRQLEVSAYRSATDLLADASIAIDVKCSNGLCGLCATRCDAAAMGCVAHRNRAQLAGASAASDFLLLTRSPRRRRERADFSTLLARLSGAPAR